MKRVSATVFALALGVLIPAAGMAQETDIQTAKKIFPTMTEAIHLFADRVDSLSTPEEFIQATTEYARTVEEFGKEEVRLLKEHQEWFDETPAELSDVLTAYREAMSRYDPAVQAATRYANDHSEHEGCQEAMQRLATALYEKFR
jgi:hypothetical protein